MFEQFEESRAKGQPIVLFLFMYGDSANSFYAYTDAEQPVEYNGHTYQPIPIDCDPVSASGTLDKASLTITTPKTTGLAELYRIYPPSQVVNGVIYTGHFGDPDAEFKAIWTGRVLSCSREQNEAKFTCEPVSTSLKRNGLRRRYQYGCPHVLYGPSCRANKAAATRTAAATAVAGLSVSLNPGWNGSFAATSFIGGMVEYVTSEGTQIRTILQAASGGVQLAGVPRGLEPGMPIDVILGCKHTVDDCRNLHNNILNYGGQPWIPTKNPIANVSQY